MGATLLNEIEPKTKVIYGKTGDGWRDDDVQFWSGSRGAHCAACEQDDVWSSRCQHHGFQADGEYSHLRHVFIHSQSHRRLGDFRGAGRLDSDALRACHQRSLGAGFADRHDRQYAGIERFVEVHVHVGRSDSIQFPRAGDHRRSLISLPVILVRSGAESGQVLQTCYDQEHGSRPLSVGISPDGSILAVGYAPNGIILWNVRTGDRRKLLQGHSNWVVSLAFSADNKRLISGAGDSTARIWDVESGKEVGRIRFPDESSYVEGVGLSPKADVAFAAARGRLVVAKTR